jgi:phosphate transport system substrate-binding protein
MRWHLFWSLVLILALGSAAACKRSEHHARTVLVDGSSTVFPITEAVAEEYQKANPGQRVVVGVSGTGGGFKKFISGEIDIVNASRPVSSGEAKALSNAGIEFLELPIAYDGLAIVVHPKNAWANDISTGELKKLWQPEAQAAITRWNQIRSDWPDKEIHLYGAGVDSGTYDYFTQAIVGEEHSSRGDFTSSEDDNVLVQGIAGDELALGFFGLAYYEENSAKLKLLPVDDRQESTGAGAVAPSLETVMNGTYQPLSRPLFIYINKKSLSRPEVESFVHFYLKNAGSLVKEVGYIPLQSSAYDFVKERVDHRMTGSLFGNKGSQVGVRIDKLLETNRISDR